MLRDDFCILITKELIFAGFWECAKILQISIDQQALYAGILRDTQSAIAESLMIQGDQIYYAEYAT